MPEESLRGQVVLVTGGGRRIGRVIALTFARAGADVAVNYFNSRAEALRTLKEIQALGRSAIALRADVSKPAEVRRMFSQVKRRFHRLDVLVNNAGIFFPVRWDRLSEKDWDRVLSRYARRLHHRPGFCCGRRAIDPVGAVREPPLQITVSSIVPATRAA